MAITFSTQNSKGNNNELKSTKELSPFFSIKPLKNSLHPKYKLWEEMNSQEQEEALKDSQKIMKKYGELIAPSDKGRRQWQSIKHGSCVFDEDVGKNGHKLCGPKPSPPCSFISGLLSTMQIPHKTRVTSIEIRVVKIRRSRKELLVLVLSLASLVLTTIRPATQNSK